MSCAEIANCDVIVTHFINPHLFWFRVNDAQSQDEDKLVRDIEDKLTSMYFDEQLTESPKLDVGDRVAVNFMQWSRCIRADVICLQQIKADTLDYILWASDHGFPLCSAIKYIRHLPTSFISTTSPIMIGGIDDVQPAERRTQNNSLSPRDTMQLTSQWQWSACIKLEEVLQDAKRIQMTQKFTHSGKIWGQLSIVRNDDLVIDAADFLIKNEVALRGGRSFERNVGTLNTTKISPWLTNDGTNLFQINSVELQQLVEAKSPLLFSIGDLECTEKNLQSVERAVSNVLANNSDCLSTNNFDVTDFGSILYDAVLSCMAPKMTNERGEKQIATMKQNAHDSKPVSFVSTQAAKAATLGNAFRPDLCNVMESWCGLPLEQLTNITITSWLLNGISDDFYAQRSDKPYMAKMAALQELIDKYVDEHKAVTRCTFDNDWFHLGMNCIVKYRGRYGRAKTYGTYVREEDGISTRHYIFFLCDYAAYDTRTAEDFYDGFLYETADQIVSFAPYQAVHCVLAGIYLKQNAAEQYKIETEKYLACTMDEHCTVGSGAACMAMVKENELEIRSFTVLIYELEWLNDFWALKMLNIDFLQSNLAVIDSNTKNYLEMGMDGFQTEKALQSYLQSQMIFSKYLSIEQCYVYVAERFEQKPIDGHTEATNPKNIDDLDSDDCETLVNFPPSTRSRDDDRSMHMLDCDELYIDIPDDPESDKFSDYDKYDLHKAADEAGAGVQLESGHVVDLWAPMIQMACEGSLDNDPDYLGIWGAANSVNSSAELSEMEIIEVKSCRGNEERVANYQQGSKQIGIEIPKITGAEQENYESFQHHEILSDCDTGLKEEDTDAKKKFDNKPTAEKNTDIKRNRRNFLDDFGLEPMEDSSVKVEFTKPPEDETDSNEGKVCPAQIQHSIETRSDADGGGGDGAVDSLDESVVFNSLRTADNGGGDQATLPS